MSDELVPSGTTMARQRGGTLTERADSLNAALEAGRGRIETTLIERSATTISRARERLSLSGEHTIVGFSGRLAAVNPPFLRCGGPKTCPRRPYPPHHGRRAGRRMGQGRQRRGP